jgi:hypothetical protein
MVTLGMISWKPSVSVYHFTAASQLSTERATWLNLHLILVDIACDLAEERVDGEQEGKCSLEEGLHVTGDGWKI